MGRTPNIAKWLTLLAFVCCCVFGAVAWGQKIAGKVELPPYTLYCDWSQSPGGCSGPGNPTLTVTRSTVQWCPDSTALRTASYTSTAINTACITPGAGLLVEGQRYNYLGLATLAGATPTTGATPPLAVGDFTYWTRGGDATLDVDICKTAGTATVTINGVTVTGGLPAAGGTCYGVNTTPATGTRITTSVAADAVLTFVYRQNPTFHQLENGPFISTPVENAGAWGTSTFRAEDAPSLPPANVFTPAAFGLTVVATTEWDTTIGGQCAGLGCYFVSVNNDDFSPFLHIATSDTSGANAAINFQAYTAGAFDAYQIGVERQIDAWRLNDRLHVRHPTAATTANSDIAEPTVRRRTGMRIFLGNRSTAARPLYGWVKSLKICAGPCRAQLRQWGNP